MKTKSTYLLPLAIALFLPRLIFAQSNGDYRSNVAAGLWSNASTWQIFSGGSWIAASTAPSSTDGAITISTGDSIILNNAVTMDQVAVANGGVLAIFNTVTATTFTLADGTGDDMVIDGRVYISVGATLSGAGTLKVNSDGNLVVLNSGVLSVATDNSGLFSAKNTANITGTTLTNNGTLVWSSNNISLTNAFIVNNDSIAITASTNVFLNSTGTCSLTNAAAGVIYNATSGITVNIIPPFTNSGTVKGFGAYTVTTTTANTGIIAPGNSPGILTVNPGFVTSSSPSLNLEISTTGGAAGTNYDQLQFSTAGSVSLSGATLNLTDNASDPINTVYTLLSSPTGTITGTFATTNYPSNFGNLTYNASSVTIEKLSILPLTWGSFNAIAQANEVALNWTTEQESNTDYFAVQYSTDGSHYTTVGTLPAQGFSSTPSAYSFTHATPDLSGINYYRIQQVDNDGKSTYSAIRTVRFDNGQAAAVQAFPNPVKDVLQLTVQTQNITVRLSDLSGTLLRSWQLQPGAHEVYLGNLPAGTYQLTIYRKQQRIGTQRLLKL